MDEINRRQFMKKTVIMGAAATAFPTIIAKKSRAKSIDKLVVHPDVDNLRVVGITDSNMTIDNAAVSSWGHQEKLVAKEVVWENVDRLACSLVETEDPGNAWRSIFVKPPGKSWTDTVVAIKTNNISRQHTRSAVMAKICHALTDILAVKPSNIHIYDACHGGSISKDGLGYEAQQDCSKEKT